MAELVESDLEPDLEKVADQMMASYEDNDPEAYRVLFAPGAVVWLSYLEGTMSADDNADLLGNLYDGFAAQLRYQNMRRRRTRDGYVQQHDLVIVAKSGATIRAGACSVVQVDADNYITRLNEYFDTKILQFGQDQQTASIPQPESWAEAATAVNRS